MVKRVSACERVALYADLLAAGRVYLHPMSPWNAVSSYLTRFILTPKGGIVSVALSLELPPVAVSDCHTLRCPDFPLTSKDTSDRLMNCLNLV
jgi:hypothetical protein